MASALAITVMEAVVVLVGLFVFVIVAVSVVSVFVPVAVIVPVVTVSMPVVVAMFVIVAVIVPVVTVSMPVVVAMVVIVVVAVPLAVAVNVSRVDFFEVPGLPRGEGVFDGPLGPAEDRDPGLLELGYRAATDVACDHRVDVGVGNCDWRRVLSPS